MNTQSWIVRSALVSLLAASVCLSGCRKNEAAASSTPANPAEEAAQTSAPAPIASGPSSAPVAALNPAAVASTAPAAPARVPKGPVPAEIWKEFSGARAYEEVQKQVDVGPRASGTPDIDKARALIEQALKANGWDVERQEFTAPTPRGATKFVNIIGRYSLTGAAPAQKNTQQAIICSHYDTKRFSFIKFLGACDGGSSTGSLIELSRVLALDPALAAKVELVFFDGEEAMVQFTPPGVAENENDGLWGSRHYASDLLASGRSNQFKFGILWDMIGDRDFKITLPPDSPKGLAQDVFSASEALGLRSNFHYFDRQILDDHVYLNSAHVPAIDFIDFDIKYWHTADDTIDKLTPESLQNVGAVTLYYLKKRLQ